MPGRSAPALFELTHTWLRNPLLPSLPLWAARASQARAQRLHALGGADDSVLSSRVTGFTTPAVSDLGGASLRVRFLASSHSTSSAVQDGGYLLACRASPDSQWLPAIAGVPGKHGLDRFREGRENLAELMVLARPLDCGDGGASGTAQRVTFLHEPALRAIFPVDSALEIVILHRCTNFFLGLNAGRWLTIRMTEIAKFSAECLDNDLDRACDKEEQEVAAFLEGTPLRLAFSTEDPPQDSAYLFEHMALSGNGGVTGQAVVREQEVDPDARL